MTLSRNGLSTSEALLRLERDGPNAVQEVTGISVWGILLRQISNSLTIVSSRMVSILEVCDSDEVKVLLLTMGLSFGIDDYIEGGVITAVILLNIIVG